MCLSHLLTVKGFGWVGWGYSSEWGYAQVLCSVAASQGNSNTWTKYLPSCSRLAWRWPHVGVKEQQFEPVQLGTCVLQPLLGPTSPTYTGQNQSPVSG